MSRIHTGRVAVGATLVFVGMAIGHSPSFAQQRPTPAYPHVIRDPPVRPVQPLPPGPGFNGCGGGPDCVPFDLSTQAHCAEEQGQATGDARWSAGLSLQTDNQLLQGDIVAYRLQWFNGGWSSYYVPGVNDIDYKFNPGNQTMRRMWSYFSDHAFSYIICR